MLQVDWPAGTHEDVLAVIADVCEDVSADPLLEDEPVT